MTYCVPWLLEHLTGQSENLQAALGNQQITGVMMPLLLKCLQDKGYKVEEIQLRSKPTVLQLSRCAWPEPCVVTINGHVLLLKDKKLFDNSHPRGVFGHFYGYRLYKVEQVWEIKRT